MILVPERLVESVLASGFLADDHVCSLLIPITAGTRRHFPAARCTRLGPPGLWSYRCSVPDESRDQKRVQGSRQIDQLGLGRIDGRAAGRGVDQRVDHQGTVARLLQANLAPACWRRTVVEP